MALFRRRSREPAPKQYAPVDIQPGLAPDTGCFASDRITVDGEPVGYMMHDEDGWDFFAGDEDEAYTSDPDKAGLFSLNTIANYDRAILPYLDAPVGTAWLRSGDSFVADVDDADEGRRSEQVDGLHPDFPTVVGYVDLTDHWAITLSRPMNRRFEDSSVVLWIPDLITIWVYVVVVEPDARPHADERPEDRRDAFDVQRWTSGLVSAVSYRVSEPAVDARRPSLTCLASQPGTGLTMAVYFDDEQDVALAYEVVRSIDALAT